MDTQKSIYGLHNTFLVAVALVLINYQLSGSVYARTGAELLGKMEDLLSYPGTSDGEDESWEMVQKKGNQFVLNDQPFYVNGFNTYWLMVFAADQSTRGKVSELFEEASSVGLTVCRTWAFNDAQWRALQKSPSVYDEDVFKALDFVVSEAKKYKIRLIFSLVNNWDAYGGKPQYVKWGKAAGLNLTSDDEFFSHPTLKRYYKAHVKPLFFVSRLCTIASSRWIIS